MPRVNGSMLKGRVAVVTGSTSRIGLRIARALAADGAAVLLNGFRPQAAFDAAIATSRRSARDRSQRCRHVETGGDRR